MKPYTWSLVAGSGKLPHGLALSSSGVISGKATATGTFTFVVKVVDTKTVGDTADLGHQAALDHHQVIE